MFLLQFFFLMEWQSLVTVYAYRNIVNILYVIIIKYWDALLLETHSWVTWRYLLRNGLGTQHDGKHL